MFFKNIGIEEKKIATYDKEDFYDHWEKINQNLGERWDSVIKYNPHHNINHTLTDRYLVKAITKFLDKWLPKNHQKKKILKYDLYNEATGTSEVTDWLIKQGFDFWGVDISKEVVKRAKKNFGHKVSPNKMKVGDVRMLPFPDNTFDVVWSYGTIEHIRENQQAVNEAFRVLKPGGLFISGLNNRLDLWGSYLVNEFTNKIYKHITSYEASFFPWSQREWLIQAGFINIKTNGTVMFPHLIRYLDLFIEWKIKNPLLKSIWNNLIIKPFIFIAEILDEIDIVRIFGTHTNSRGVKPKQNHYTYYKSIRT